MSFPPFLYQLWFLPAIMGSLVVPLVYQIAVELHMSRWSAFLAGLFIVIGRYELPPFPVPVTVLACHNGKPSCHPCIPDCCRVTYFTMVWAFIACLFIVICIWATPLPSSPSLFRCRKRKPSCPLYAIYSIFQKIRQVWFCLSYFLVVTLSRIHTSLSKQPQGTYMYNIILLCRWKAL